MTTLNDAVSIAQVACIDDDLEMLSRDQLLIEAKTLRSAIRKHRDATGHDLCWHHPQMWSLLPEALTSSMAVPEWPHFMRGCIRYRQSLDEQAPEAPRVSQELIEASHAASSPT